MLVYRLRGIFTALFAIQMAAASLLFWFYVILIESLVPNFELASLNSYFIYNVAVILGLLFFGIRFNVRKYQFLQERPQVHSRLALSQVLHVLFALLVFLVAAKDRDISRLFLFTYIPLLYLQLFYLNWKLPPFLCRCFFTENRSQKILLLGPSAKADMLVPWLRKTARLGFEVAGIITDDDEKRLPKIAFPILGGSDDIERAVRENGVGILILLQIPASTIYNTYLIELAERRGLRLMIFNNLEDRFNHSLSYFHHDGFDFISLRQEPLEDPANRIIKRLGDILVSLPVVLLFLPLLLTVTWIFQALQSKGPVFYRQKRSGMANREFSILKLRTMCCGNDDHARQATQDDDRIYPFGRFLRKSSLDEMPQFWNVLVGDMSVVGPRPHMVEHDKIFARMMKSYHVRTYVRPGITGLAQVRGFRGEANEEAIVSRVQCDIEYIESWSPMLDVLIIFSTAKQVLFPPKTAY